MLLHLYKIYNTFILAIFKKIKNKILFLKQPHSNLKYAKYALF